VITILDLIQPAGEPPAIGLEQQAPQQTKGMTN
jgi:hypothetical protein